MRKLSIHLGLHKTGTSYLQALLVNNREALATAGLAVPPAAHKDSHEQFARALRESGPRGFFNQVDWELGDQQVISCEGLGSLLCAPKLALAKPLAVMARRQNIMLRLILFLRRQDLLKESVFSEAVKTWYCGTIEDEQHYEYDFDRRLNYLEAAFGQENISVAIYQKNGPRPLAAEFLDLLGIDASHLDLVNVEQKNIRMNRRETLFLSQVPKEDTRYAAAVRFAVERNEFISDDGHRNLMSPDQRAAFLADFREGNEALMARYGLSNPTWTDPVFGDESAWTPPRPIESQEYISVMMEVAAIAWAEAMRRTEKR